MSDPPRNRPTRGVALLLMAEALALDLYRWAEAVRFDWFAFFDPGADLAEHALMARGLRPTIDFGYLYGLLPLAVGELAYGLAGLRPVVFVALCVSFGMVTAWGIGRALEALRVGPVGVAWVVAMMPLDLVQPAYPSLAHAIEPALLAQALADLAGGRRRRALALATACVFVKPSMGYVCGAVVLGAIAFRDRPGTWRDWLARMAPAAAVGSVLSLALAGMFGVEPLLRTVLPMAGRAVYRANRFGFFFGTGRAFWLSRRPRWGDYFGTLVGVWLSATLVLIAAAVASMSRKRREAAERRGAAPAGVDVLAACAVMHGAFVLFFFGNRWSWFYYGFVLVLGVATVEGRSRAGRAIVAGLTLLALPAAVSALKGPWEAWSGRSAPAETFGLWASPEVVEEWRTVRRLTRGSRPVLLATTDGLAVIDPEFARPEVSFLVRGHDRPGELARKAAQVEAAEMVVVARAEPGGAWFDEWPEFSRALRGHRLAWSCDRLRLYQRSGARRGSRGDRVGAHPPSARRGPEVGGRRLDHPGPGPL